MSRALAGGRLTAAALIVCSLVTLAPQKAEAQSVADRLRLSADLTFFEFTKFNASFGGFDSDTKGSYFGFLNQGLGLSVGASIGDMLFIGGRLVLERAQSHDEGDDSSQLGWALEPFVELMFLDQGPVVPFALAGLGLQGLVDDDGSSRDKTTFFGFRFGGGAHIFLAESFSLDPRVEFGWATDVGGEDDVDISRIRFGIVVGLSGWFGGGDPAPSYGGETVQPLPGAGPGSTTVANSTTETLDFGGGVSATLYGVPGQSDMTVRFQRRGAAPVLQGCSQITWQVDGQAAQMAVGYTPTQESGGVLETLEGKTASNNAALLANARVVTLTVCGASFNLTPQHLQQLGDFNQRLQAQQAPQQNDPWGAPGGY